MSEDPALCIMRTDVHRRVTRFGMRGQRIGEAKNPGPGSHAGRVPQVRHTANHGRQ